MVVEGLRRRGRLVGRVRTLRARLHALVARLQEALDQVQALTAELAAEKDRCATLRQERDALKGQVLSQAKALYGRKTEQSPAVKKPEPGPAQEGAKKRGQRRGRPGHGRRAYGHLPAVDVVHEPDRVCPRCGRPAEPCGEETSTEIDVRVVVRRIVHHRRKYVCRCGGRVRFLIAPPRPRIWPRALLTPGTLAQIVVDKYLLMQPLHRIAARLALQGIRLAEGSLVGMFDQLLPLVEPLVAAFRERNRCSPRLYVDETRWRRLWAIHGPKGWLWVFVGPDTTVFLLATSRGHEVIEAYLGLTGDDPARKAITLICDFMSAYDALHDQVERARCWVHLRRLILDCVVRSPESRALRKWVNQWVAMVDDLFRLWAERHRAEPDSVVWQESDLALRGCAEEMAETRARQLRRRSLPPDARRVLTLADKHWGELERCVQDPEIRPDNNTAERAIRNPACGRKAFAGSGSEDAERFTATMFTLLATVKQNGLNPVTFLQSYLTAVAQAGGKAPEDLQTFCPWQMTEAVRTKMMAPPEAEPG